MIKYIAKVKYFFGIVILLKCWFLSFSDEPIRPFLLASKDMEVMSKFQYCYAALEIVTLFAIMLLFWCFLNRHIQITHDRTGSVGAYMLMVGMDVLDFALRGNSEWFMVGKYPITNNIFMFFCYIILTWNLEVDSRKHDISRYE